MSWAIEASGITKYYGNNLVLKGIDLQVPPGEKLTIVGPNGAGKTSLLKILATISRPASGTAIVAGFDLRERPLQVRRSIGVISHQTYLYNDLSVLENLRFYARMYDVPNIDDHIGDLLQRVGLTHRKHDVVGTLSRGMQQRVCLARAAVHNPPILLLDEPDTGLDQQASDLLRTLLLGFDDQKRTAIMTTHNLDLGLRICDRVAILAKGKIRYIQPGGGTGVESFRKIYDELTGAQT
ncbi:MAG: heme ABC exporter ATP-binding protein CcmA [Chloroflexi bacterium]|nr:heme ABC exporter ATP-binding protein CcmA [Chloroflexota bacterium]